MNEAFDWVMVIIPETSSNWVPHMIPPAPKYKFGKWKRVRGLVEGYFGPNLYVSTALAAIGGIRQKLFGDNKTS